MVGSYKNKAIIDAYCAVNVVAKKDVALTPHKTIIANALVDVWQYDKPFPGETDDLMIARHELETPASGEAAELAAHFRDIDPELVGDSQWVVIFKMYNQMKRLEGEVELSSGSDKISKTEKENENMSEAEKTIQEQTAAQDAVDKQMQDILGKHGIDTGDSGDVNPADVINGVESGDINTNLRPSDPTKVDSSFQEAARDAIVNDKERYDRALNTRLVGVALAQVNPVDKLVEKENPKGTIINAADVLRKFKEKTGAEVAATPSGSGEGGVVETVSFKYIQNTPENIENARSMYSALVRAASGENVELDVNISKASTSVKFYKLQTGTEKDTKWLTQQEILDYSVFKAPLGQIDTSVQVHTEGGDKNTFVRYKKATRKNSSKSSSARSGVERTASDKKNPFAGVVVLMWSDKKATLAANNFTTCVKKVSTETKVDRGFSSKLAVKYVKGRDSNDNEKLATFRIPLDVNQYTIEVVDTFKDLMVTRNTTKSNADMTDKEKDNMISEQVEILSTLKANGYSSEFLDSVMKVADEAVAAKAKADAAANAEFFAGMKID